MHVSVDGFQAKFTRTELGRHLSVPSHQQSSTTKLDHEFSLYIDDNERIFTNHNAPLKLSEDLAKYGGISPVNSKEQLMSFFNLENSLFYLVLTTDNFLMPCSHSAIRHRQRPYHPSGRALLQLRLHSWLSTQLQWVGQRQLQLILETLWYMQGCYTFMSRFMCQESDGGYLYRHHHDMPSSVHTARSHDHDTVTWH